MSRINILTIEELKFSARNDMSDTSESQKGLIVERPVNLHTTANRLSHGSVEL